MKTQALSKETASFQRAMKKSMNEAKHKLEERIEDLEHKKSDLEYAISQLERLDVDKASFTVTIDDDSSRAYSSIIEKETTTHTGLKNALELAEANFERRYGKIRTDGWVIYRVTTPVGNQNHEVPMELWAKYTKQTLDSLKKAKKF